MITCNNLYFSYLSNDKYTLKDINFKIDKGEIFGFLGPSGSGKTTTQKLLTHLLKTFDGDITILNKDIRKWGVDLYEHVGVGFELPNHYSKLTALENLKLFSSFYERDILPLNDLLERVNLQDSINTKVEQFSKGMKMRLNFVRAIMHNPDVLFLDEPTSGLDPLNAKRIKNMIRELKDQGKTIFLTTHNMNDADELCNRVAFLLNGEIKLIDNPESLKINEREGKVKVEYLNDNNKQSQSIFELEQLGTNKAFIDLLNQKEIRSLHSIEPNLEEIFIKITGVQLQ